MFIFQSFNKYLIILNSISQSKLNLARLFGAGEAGRLECVVGQVEHDELGQGQEHARRQDRQPDRRSVRVKRASEVCGAKTVLKTSAQNLPKQS